MRCNDPQGLTIQGDIGHNRSAWLQPRQGDRARFLNLCTAQKQQISVPAMRSVTQFVGQGDRSQPCFALQQIRIKYPFAVAKAPVNLLQGHDISTDFSDNLHSSRRVATQIGTNSLVYII